MKLNIERLMSGHRPLIILTLLCAALFLPGVSALPPTDRDEARFMQATKQMFETSDYLTIRFQAEPRTKKPIGIHWLQALSVQSFAAGDTMAVWAYRLPSIISAWLAVLCTFFIGRRLFCTQTGFIAAGLLACTLLTVVEAHLAKTDATLLLCCTVAHLALCEFYLAKFNEMPPFRTAVFFWMAIGAGLLIKGPVIIAVVGTTIAALCLLDRNTRWLRGLEPTVGVPIAMAFILPWLIGSAMMGNGDVIFSSLSEDFLPKLASGQEGHGALPGSYLLASPLLLWPASLLILPGMALAWLHRTQPNIRFVLVWGAASWLMFELVPTKLPHYILPAVPGLALAAAAAAASLNINYAVPRWSKVLWGLCGALLAIGLGWASLTYSGSLLVAGIIGATLLVTTALTWTPQRNIQTLVPALAVAVFGLVFSVLLPGLKDLDLSTRLTAAAARHANGPIVLSQYHEPSAVFLLGTDTRLTNHRLAAAHVVADPAALAVVSDRDLAATEELIVAGDGALVIVDRVNGYNYSKGREENLVLIRSDPDLKQP